MKLRKIYRLQTVVGILIVSLLSSCATLLPSPHQHSEKRNGDLIETQKRLIEGAEQFLGVKSLKVGKREFRMDCSGVVSAVYAYAGIDLTAPLSAYTGNGVARLYRYLDDEDLLYRTQNPVPGDIIFWDNTWDANEDGEFNDPFTHVGMVVNRLSDGTIEYIHHNYRKGIVLERMNLHSPDERSRIIDGETILLNSPIRARSAPKAPGGISLASQLYRHLGMGWKL